VREDRRFRRRSRRVASERNSELGSHDPLELAAAGSGKLGIRSFEYPLDETPRELGVVLLFLRDAPEDGTNGRIGCQRR
jgi:hypothetical protein